MTTERDAPGDETSNRPPVEPFAVPGDDTTAPPTAPPLTAPMSQPTPPPPPPGARRMDAQGFATAPPPGYVPFGAGPIHLEGTSGLRKAALILFGVVIISNVVVAAVLFSRKTTFDDAVAGRATIFDVDRADQQVAVASIVNILLVVAAGIVLSIWSLRAARNMQAVGAMNVSPGWACGGWYIPIGNLWVPWQNLRRGHKSLGGDTKALSWWQGMWVVSSLVTFSIRGSLDSTGGSSTRQVSDQLQQQGTYASAQTVALVVAIFLAAKAMQRIEASTAERAG